MIVTNSLDQPIFQGTGDDSPNVNPTEQQEHGSSSFGLWKTN